MTLLNRHVCTFCHSLRFQSDPDSKARLSRLEQELSVKEEESDRLTKLWRQEKEKLEARKKIQQEIENLRVELAKAQRQGDLNKASEILYGKIPGLQKQLKEGESQNLLLLSDAVTEKEIAIVVSRATGESTTAVKVFSLFSAQVFLFLLC